MTSMWLSHGQSRQVRLSRRSSRRSTSGFHDLRHSCVTLLLLLGVPPHIVQAIVGHADVHVTMTIYAHASLEDQRKALDKLAVLLAG